MTRDLSEILRDIVAWCCRKGVQDWFSGVSLLVTVGLGVWAIYASCAGHLEQTVHGWKYLSVAIMVPICQFLGWRIDIAVKKQLDKVTAENGSLKNRLQRVSLIEENMESIFGVWLNLILGEMKMDGECRASFYVWDDKGNAGNEFVYLARESTDPTLKRKGRDRFPGNQGVISAAWHSSTGFASYFASRMVKTDEDVVNDMVKTYEFPRSVAEALTMKSRVIVGHVIMGRQGKLGIVVIESLHSALKKEKRAAYEKRCAEVVRKVTPHLTRLFEIYSNSMFKQEDPLEESQ